jgi:hypothetical protein
MAPRYDWLRCCLVYLTGLATLVGTGPSFVCVCRQTARPLPTLAVRVSPRCCCCAPATTEAAAFLSSSERAELGEQGRLGVCHSCCAGSHSPDRSPHLPQPKAPSPPCHVIALHDDATLSQPLDNLTQGKLFVAPCPDAISLNLNARSVGSHGVTNWPHLDPPDRVVLYCSLRL